MLLLEEIKNILKNQTKKNSIYLSIKHQERVRFHVESNLPTDFSVRNNYSTEFLTWVRALIPEDKFKTFKSLYLKSSDTLNLTGDIFNVVHKVFDGQNPVYNCVFKNDEKLTDWNEYRVSVLKEPQIWENKGFEMAKDSSNSFLVVDLPREQLGTSPDPYFYWVEMDSVIDYEVINDDVQYIVFRISSTLLAVYDNEAYQVFETKPDTLDIIGIEVQESHELGYCPVIQYVSDNLNNRNHDVKRNLVSDQLDALDWLKFFSISKRFADLYAPYTIYWGYEGDCDYSINVGDDEHYCSNGFMRSRTGDANLLNGIDVVPCPICKTKLAGAGSYVDVPAPSSKEDPILAPPVGKIDVDRDSLDYLVTEIQRLKAEIFKSITGGSIEPINDQAVNEKQVMSLFEARKQVLNRYKKLFERAQEFTTKTICKLKYGDSFESINIDYGTEFYLYDESFILDLYTVARDKNLDHATLDMLQDQYYATVYRHDPEQLMRMNVLMNIDPFRHLTTDKLIQLRITETIPYEDFNVKINMSTFVKKFERENGSLQNFGSEIDFSRKIDTISDTLKGYVTEEVIKDPVII